MEFESIYKILRVSGLLGSLFFLIAYLFLESYFAIGFLAGFLWGILNLLFIKEMVKSFFSDPRKITRLVVSAFFKFPILYCSGFYLLAWEDFSVVSLLTGFVFVFVVMGLVSFHQAFRWASVSILVFACTALHASSSLESDVPELPSIFALIASHFVDSPLASFLYHWETILFSVMIASSISILFYLCAKKPALIPSSLQNFLELIIDYLHRFIIEILGPQGEKYVPFLGTLFIYILTMNWVALLPFMKPPTSSLNVTVALALCVFCLVQYLNIKNFGILGFLYHMAGSPKNRIEWMLVPLMLPIEMLTQITRPLTLALRLFGNVLGEDILVGAAALFGVFLLSSFDLAIGLPMQLPFMFLVLLTGLMQALVFTLLSTVYILLSSAQHEENHKP